MLDCIYSLAKNHTQTGFSLISLGQFPSSQMVSPAIVFSKTENKASTHNTYVMCLTLSSQGKTWWGVSRNSTWYLQFFLNLKLLEIKKKMTKYSDSFQMQLWEAYQFRISPNSKNLFDFPCICPGLIWGFEFPTASPDLFPEEETLEWFRDEHSGCNTPSAPAVIPKLSDIRSMAWQLFDVGSMIYKQQSWVTA